MGEILFERGRKALVMDDSHLDMLMNPRKMSDDEGEGDALLDGGFDVDELMGGEPGPDEDEEEGDEEPGRYDEEEEEDDDEGPAAAPAERPEPDEAPRWQQQQPPPQPPSSLMSKEEISNTKRELLYRFDRLEKKGVRVTRKYSMASDLSEMQADYDRLVKDRDADAGIRFQKQVLVTMVSGLEYLNRRFDPFDFHLDGWSETVHENLEDYDDVLEELHAKYRGKAKMAPELKLLMMLVGSAFMFHMTKKLSDVMPGMGEILTQNPDLQRQFAGAAANMVQKDDGGSGLGGLAGMFSGMFQQKEDAKPMRGPTSAPPPAPPAPPAGRSSAADVLSFMRARNGAVVSEDNVEIMSQSDASEISEVVSLSGKKRAGGKKRSTLDL